jgi:AraC family transcriptional regulator
MALKNTQRAEYIGRINRVLDYIETHLSEPLPLVRLAEVARFSPFHFHRIFSALVGETLSSFIQRVRAERAAMLLLANPGRAITEIALDCGFSGSATFARVFKELFGMSASDWRSGGAANRKKCKTVGNIRNTVDKICEVIRLERLHTGSVNHNPTWRIEMFTTEKKEQKRLDATIEVKEMPTFHVIYLRHVGPYAGDPALFERLYERLADWAAPRDLLSRPDARCLCVYHDDPNVTDAEKLRLSICLTVPEGTPVDGEIGQMIVPGGKFAVGHFEILPDQYGDAWDALMGGWLPDSGYQPDDRLPYEMGLNDPKSHPEGKHIVDICMPVKPL